MNSLFSSTSPALGVPAFAVADPLALSLISSPDTNPFVSTLSAGPLALPQAVSNPVINSPNIQNNAQLQQSVAKIQQDPTGAQLLNAALSKGYTIRVGDTGGSGEPGVVVEGLTVTNGQNGNEIILSANASDFDKTLVHELFHAATQENGDSQLEEGLANVIGDMVSARINGRTARNPFEILRETLPFYQELPLVN